MKTTTTKSQTEVAEAAVVEEPLAIFKLCHKCNKEFELELGTDNAGTTSTFQKCPHCGVRNDTWFYAPKRPARYREWHKESVKAIGVPPPSTREAIERAIYEALGDTPFHVTRWEREAQTKAVLDALAPHLSPASDANDAGRLQAAVRAIRAETERADYALRCLAWCIFQAGGRIAIDHATVMRIPSPRPDVRHTQDHNTQQEILWIDAAMLAEGEKKS